MGIEKLICVTALQELTCTQGHQHDLDILITDAQFDILNPMNLVEIGFLVSTVDRFTGTLKAYMGDSTTSTVFAAELQGIRLALTIVLED